MQILTGGVTAPSTSLTDLTMFTGDSKTVLSGMGRAFIMNAWSFSQAAGYLTVHSPKMHDDQTGMKMRHISQLPMSLWPIPFKQEVGAQDVLTLAATGSATASDQETHHLLMHYQTPGSAGGRYITYEEMISNQEHILSLEFAITAGTTAIYGGATALSGAAEDKLKGNRDYAVIGYAVSVVQGAITFRGPDTGNWRVGGPGHTIREFTKNYFADLARAHQGPYIPVFNSSQKNATYVETTNNENAASPVVTLYLALLR
jgi:hypothetical protein